MSARDLAKLEDLALQWATLVLQNDKATNLDKGMAALCVALFANVHKKP